MKKYKVAVVGGTGLVGKTLLNVLQEVDFPISTLDIYASKRTEGTFVKYNNQDHKIKALSDEIFERIYDFVFMVVDAEISKKYSERLSDLGAYVIDNSSAYRQNGNIPLVAFGANEKILQINNRLLANPNCSTIQSVVALKDIHDNFGISSIDYVTYQAVSGSGYEGLNDYIDKTQLFYPKQIYANVIPQIDEFLGNGFTKEEVKMVNETQRILDAKISITATCVRVPVEIGHSVVATITTKNIATIKDIESMYEKNKHIVYYSNNKYPTPLDSVGNDLIHIGRVRVDPNNPHRIILWIVADNLRKGAASNAVQIAQYIIKQQWIENANQ